MRTDRSAAPAPRRWLIGIVAALLAVGGWSVWSAGLFESSIATQLRTSSVWADPSLGLDTAAAERLIGDRRLVVIVRAEGATESESDLCDDLSRAVDGTVALILTAEPDDWDAYGCQYLFDGDDEIGRAAVVETQISGGTGAFPGRPLDAIKVSVINYDLLVTLDRIPSDARSFAPPLPRYLLAAAAIAAVLVGAGTLWLLSRRYGRQLAVRAEQLTDSSDDRAALSATMSSIARELLGLEADTSANRDRRDAAFRRYLRLTSTVTRLDGIEDDDERTVAVRDAAGSARSLLADVSGPTS
ncbi:MAG: hypothetical protein INR72_12075 [Williamsia herbipolensis]|nr:hypothetical protein [Williamsia herbipolensis]